MAAGASRRFGSDKRVFNDGNGPLLQQTLAHVLLLNLPTVVVLKQSDQCHTPTLLGNLYHSSQLTVFYCVNAEQGLGSNIAQFFCSPPPWDGALIFLGDMAWIAPDTSRLVIAGFDHQRIVLPVYRGQQGHPVLFPKIHYSRLAELKHDTGGRSLLRAENANLVLVPVNDSNILKDLDTVG